MDNYSKLFYFQKNQLGLLPIDYICQSNSSLNFICFLVYDFNTPKQVGSNDDDKKYLLKLKNQQYLDKTGNSLIYKLISIIKNEKNYLATCVQIIEELLKEKLYSMKDIEILIDFDLETDNLYDSITLDTSKLAAFYWKFEENVDEFRKRRDNLASSSPFCKIIIDIKEGTEHEFDFLLNRYLDEMKSKYKALPFLHQTLLQKEKKYLLQHKNISTKYQAYSIMYDINKEIPDDPKFLDVHEDFIFSMITTNQRMFQDKIMKLPSQKEMDKVFEKFNEEELSFLLLVRSQDKPENLLELMLKTPNNKVNEMLQTYCITYKQETFYTKKMLTMVRL